MGLVPFCQTEIGFQGSWDPRIRDSEAEVAALPAGRVFATLPTIYQSISSCISVARRAQTSTCNASTMMSLKSFLTLHRKQNKKKEKRKKTINRRSPRRPEHGPRNFDVTRRFTHSPLEWCIWLLLHENMTVSSLWWAESEFWKGDLSVAPFYFCLYHLDGDKGGGMKHAGVPLSNWRGGRTIRLCGFWGSIKRFDTWNNVRVCW